MIDIVNIIASDLKLKSYQVENTIKLLDEGSTVPFISRYRKEVTGNLDEEQIRNILEKLTYIRNLEQRKQEVLKNIEEQGKLTDELKEKILACDKLQQVEDLYLPYKQKKKTKADIAIENGLQPLADYIKTQVVDMKQVELMAEEFINENVKTVSEAITGAKLIIAQEISQEVTFREFIRYKLQTFGTVFSSLIKKNEEKDEKKVYQDYYDFKEPISKMPSHRVLALNRGENEKILSVKIQLDESVMLEIENTIITKFPNKMLKELFIDIIQDSLSRLMLPSLENEVRNIITESAEDQAIIMFKKNLHNLLMQPPIIGKSILGLDPGYRTGCKVVVIDTNGEYKLNDVFYLIHGDDKLSKSKEQLEKYIKNYEIDIIAIGNGTASRETEKFVADSIKDMKLTKPVKYIIVNEAGASVYSASTLAKEEFPTLDVTVRGAISIARRVQDPMAELVKIDPKAIGVGMYQHDVNQTVLGESLDSVVESAVNNVGVNVNTASWALLEYVSGISKTIAKNIVEYRNQNGLFTSRVQLKKVKGLGPKAYEQAAGFILVPEGKNPLDETIVHPESYEIAEKMLEAAGFKIKDLKTDRKKVQEGLTGFDFLKFATDNGFGQETTKDIYNALLKPRRDPREDMPQPLLKSDVLSIDDLCEGLEVEGTVRNVINFGAFVDIGLKNDALLHISQFPGKEFVTDPTKVLAVGDIIKAKVMSVEIDRQRVNLTMKDEIKQKSSSPKNSSGTSNYKPSQPEKELGGNIKFF